MSARQFYSGKSQRSECKLAFEQYVDHTYENNHQVNLVLIKQFFFQFLHANEKRKSKIKITKNTKSIKNTNQKFIKNENSSHLFEFHFSY